MVQTQIDFLQVAKKDANLFGELLLCFISPENRMLVEQKFVEGFEQVKDETKLAYYRDWLELDDEVKVHAFVHSQHNLSFAYHARGDVSAVIHYDGVSVLTHDLKKPDQWSFHYLV